MKRIALLAVVIGFGSACIGDGGVDVTVDGKGVQDGLQSGDGWAVSFRNFRVTIPSFEIVDSEGHTRVAYAWTEEVSGNDLAGAGATNGVTLIDATTGGYLVGAVAWEVGPVTTAQGTTSPAYDLRGTAVKGTETKSFVWSLNRTTRYSDCPLDSQHPNSIVFTIDAAPLFTNADGTSSFAAFAAADGDADEFISDDELRAAPALDGLGSNLWETLDARSKGMGFMSGNQPCLTVQ